MVNAQDRPVRFILMSAAGPPRQRGATRPARRARAIAALVLLLLSVVAFAQEPLARDRSRPNIVLLVIDTLRADALGSYGGAPTPNLDAIAGAGLRFDRMVAQAPWTLPSVSSLLTGLYPFEHGQGAHAGRPSVALSTLTDRLAAGGYTTAAFVEIDWPLMRQGFHTFELPTGSTAERYGRAESRGPSPTFLRARQWLRSNTGRPLFLMIHTYEVHDYFLGRPRHREHAAARHPSYRGPFARWQRQPIDEAGVAEMIGELLAANDDDTAFVRSLYDGAVQVVDEEVGRLDAELERQGLVDDTVLVVTSDHGEGFAPTRARVSHGGRLHEDLLHVPLILRWPGKIAPGTVDGRLESIDIAPTLLRLAGLDAEVPAAPGPDARMRGAPFLRAVRNDPTAADTVRFVPVEAEEDFAWSEESAFAVLPSGQRQGSTAHQTALYTGDHKLILSPSGGELFDLSLDPTETSNRIDVETAIADRMRSRVEEVTRELPRSPPGPRRDIAEALRSLGYAR
jgi:arylsulfatase A-like enzyme